MEQAGHGARQGSFGLAVVTGSNRGTGRGIAEVLRACGYEVCGLNRTPENDGSWEILCDVRDPDQIESAASLIKGPVSLLVLNAGIRRFGPVVSLSRKDWDDSFATNISAVFHLVRALLPQVIEARGDILVVGSTAGHNPLEGGAAYCASKAALKAFLDVLRLELQGQDVRATLLTPGAIANHDGDTSPNKMTVRSVGEVVAAVAQFPRDVTVRELEIQPTTHRPPIITGIERLQYA